MGTFFKPLVSSVQSATLVTDFVYDLVDCLRVKSASWAETLGFAPPTLMAFLDGRCPVDISIQAIQKVAGEKTYRGLNDTFVPYAIERFYSGVEESPERLMDPRSGLILSWQKAPAGMAREWSVFSNTKIAALLAAGTASGVVWTKGANFFAASGHYFNPKDTSLGSFGNSLGTNEGYGPWYVTNSGAEWGMYPWCVMRGEGPPPPTNAGSFRTADGVNAVVFDYSSEHYAKHGTLRISTEASYGYALLHPQAITRSVKAPTYENVLAAVDNMRIMKDLGGHQTSDDSGLSILAPKGMLSAFEAVLNREMCDVGGVSVSNDLKNKGIKLVALTT